MKVQLSLPHSLSILKLLLPAVLVRACCDVAASRASASSFAEVNACVFIILVGYEKLCTFLHVIGGSYNMHGIVLHSLTCYSHVGQNTPHTTQVWNLKSVSWSDKAVCFVVITCLLVILCLSVMYHKICSL